MAHFNWARIIGDFGQWEEHKAYQKVVMSEILKG
jgi:hypothetical protein